MFAGKISRTIRFSFPLLSFSYFLYSIFFLIFISQIINGKYVEGFYIYARQLLDTSTGSSAHTNPLVAAARSSSSSSGSNARSSSSTSTSASSSALISASKPNIARRDGTAYVVASSTPSTVIQSAAAYVGSTTYRMLTILNGGGASSCTMTGLLQYTLYEFFIVPFYKSVEGKPSNSRVARTLEDGEYENICAIFYYLFFCIISGMFFFLAFIMVLF